MQELIFLSLNLSRPFRIICIFFFVKRSFLSLILVYFFLNKNIVKRNEFLASFRNLSLVVFICGWWHQDLLLNLILIFAKMLINTLRVALNFAIIDLQQGLVLQNRVQMSFRGRWPLRRVSILPIWWDNHIFGRISVE